MKNVNELFASTINGNNNFVDLVRRSSVAYTHAGVFHSDDVFGAALLRIINPEITINRTFKVSEEIKSETDLIFDIGGGRFDHHFNGAPEREGGVKYSSFGLFWRELKDTLPEQVWEAVDRELVLPIDVNDNYGEGNPISAVISSFNLGWNDSRSEADAAFSNAVDFAKSALGHLISSEMKKWDALELVESQFEASADKRIVELDTPAPWSASIVAKPEPLFVLFPSDREGWMVQLVPVAPGSRETKTTFPKEWWGVPREELLDLTHGRVLFCHANGFILSAKDKDTAIELCKELLSDKEKGGDEEAH